MNIAFTASGTTWESLIDPRFGRTEFIIMFNDESNELTVFDNSAVKNDAHGAGTATAQRIFELKPDVLITGNGPGENAALALKLIKMKIFVNAQDLTIRHAYEQYRKNELIQL